MKIFFNILFFFFWNCTCFSSQVETLKPMIVAKIPHASSAFTQGLSIEKNYLYESSGLYGRSQLTCTDLNSGKVIKKRALPSNYFAEGIATFSNRVIQITWREQTAFVYDRSNLNLLYTIPYKGEGWGLCYADDALWLSDGTSILKRCNPETLSVEKLLPVKLNGRPVHFLNDLTIAGEHIYANVWPKDLIVRIDRTTGTVDGVFEASELLSPEERALLGKEDVLNGIAYHPKHNTFFVTGKGWPWIFELTFSSPNELFHKEKFGQSVPASGEN